MIFILCYSLAQNIPWFFYTLLALLHRLGGAASLRNNQSRKKEQEVVVGHLVHLWGVPDGATFGKRRTA